MPGWLLSQANICKVDGNVCFSEAEFPHTEMMPPVNVFNSPGIGKTATEDKKDKDDVSKWCAPNLDADCLLYV